jgi:hypothetical protein
VVTGSIFWGNRTTSANDQLVQEQIAGYGGTYTDSLVQGGCPLFGATCVNLLTGNPNLGPLQNNGGLTPTHALNPGSAAIDASGVNAACPAADQRGLPRPQDGNGDGSAACDLGAYEVYISPPTDWLYLPLVTGALLFESKVLPNMITLMGLG